MIRKRISKILFYIILACAYLVVSTSLLVFHGPFQGITNYIINSLATTRHGYLLRPLSLYTLSNAEIKQHSAQLVVKNAGRTTLNKDFSTKHDSNIQVFEYDGSTFKADIMLVSDPNRVKVGVTKYKGQTGETVSDMVQDAGAVAGINAGAFEDVHYRGTGGIPLGITMHNGQVVSNDKGPWTQQPVIAITKKGQLISGTYSENQLKDLGVREAVSFGPVIVQNGQGTVQGEGGWGYAPRTAIGQTADGTIILIVTDGRLVSGANDVGATLKDVQDLMLQYGAVTAANLDGGSSTTMVKDGNLVNTPTDVLGEREVATSFLVMPE